MKPAYKTGRLSAAERQRRKRYLSATLITCVALAMIGGTVHVVQLGANRMADMRAKATYDLAEEHERIRAAGEDATRHALHQQGDVAVAFTADEVKDYLTPEKWQELASMVTVAAGPFTAGTDRQGTDPQNRPAHRVDLSAYRIDKYPVSVGWYARFVASTDRRPPLDWKEGRVPSGRLTHPVTLVNWHDAQAFCAWMGKRLPTEMEWEKAARGADARRWPWGNQMDPERLNTYYSVGSTTAVDHYRDGASPYGAFDLAGNVSEWTADDFKPYPGSDAPSEVFTVKVPVARTAEDRNKGVVDLELVEDIRYKVLRGGSWKSDPFSTASYHRNYSLPHTASDFYGFRCASDDNEVES